MKHTPGPWAVESDHAAVSMRGQVVTFSPAPDEANYSEMVANARLIAAALGMIDPTDTATNEGRN